MKVLIHAVASLLAFGLTVDAHAEWPERPIKIVVPAAAGSSSDVAMRIVAEKLSPRLGQPVIVENRPGAAAVIGTDFGAKQAPDGYTFTMGAAGPISIVRWLRADALPYDAEKDFVPVASVAWAPQVLVVRKDMPVGSLRELMEHSKRPGVRLSFGTQGNGSSMHLMVSQLLHQTGMKADHIPYQSGPKTIMDLIGGQIDFVSEAVPVVLGALNNGQVKALGVTSGERIPLLPNVPTMKEQGVENYDLQSWIVLLAPVKTPDAILRRVSEATDAVTKMPDVRKRLNDLGLIPMDMPRERMASFLQTESRKWRDVVRVSGAAGSVR